MPVAPAGPKPARSHKKRPLQRCRRCPYRGPAGQCFDRRRKSGRCGDWVWYLRHGKQCRRLYVKPRDPRTPAQRYWRAMFGAASSKYSQSLTQEERRACIVAGSKLRSRPRLGQSGPLNGQHYSIRRDYATRAAQSRPDTKTSINPLQTKGVSPSTSDRYHTSATPLSHHPACPRPRAGHNQPRKVPRTSPRQTAWAGSPRTRSPAALRAFAAPQGPLAWAARRRLRRRRRAPTATRRTIPRAMPSRPRRFKYQ
jgi:hypothetical protein